MLKSSKLLLLLFTFLNLAKSKKTKRTLHYNFLGSFNANLGNHDMVLMPYKHKKGIRESVKKHKLGEHFLKYSKNENVSNSNYTITQDCGVRDRKKRKIVLRESISGNLFKDDNNTVMKNGEINITASDRIENANEQPAESINKETLKENVFDYDVNNQLEKEIISGKMENQKNEIIKKLKMPIIGTQLKPSGGFTKEILKLIRDSNDYINEVNEEIIKDKIDKKMNENDLSFFDTEKTLEEHEIKYLNKVYDNNHVLNIYNFLLVWRERKNIDLSVFVSKITEHSNLLPGERTVIKFSEIEKVQFLKKIKTNKNVCVAMIFVDNKGKNTSEAAISHNMFPIGILAHPLDLSLLDKSGEISVLNLYRFKINSYNVTNTDFLVNAELFVDNNKKLNNFELTQENKKIIMNLYDKILELKIKYTEKIGDKKENEKFKHLEKITDRIDEYVSVLNINKSIDFKNNDLNFFTSLYLEYFSFLAIDIHATIPTKLQMMYTDDTEMRLHNVKTFLMQIYDELKVKLRGL
ncbi:hypothetical protein, conserved [Plasmodium gonderi]|uniref:Uncharacterized protein n=1 Tax=Plasmodium gonderi TaxID=77519 RepID=A0A1Y1JLU5_PLAGO|nr:hypothetical protein, conserved [Plasmodium gonderi]GAW81343.1 hypothetical protein, conserved [Plasmodium gonderi]